MPTVACPQCNSTNRVPQVRLTDNPNCGRCGAPLFHGRPVTLTAANFDRHANAELPLLVDFWAEWCGPCKIIGPSLEELAEELADKVTITKLNIEENPDTPGSLGIRGIPTLFVYKDGQKIAQQVGIQDISTKSKLKAWIESVV